jgi:hypothetical protein
LKTTAGQRVLPVVLTFLFLEVMARLDLLVIVMLVAKDL